MIRRSTWIILLVFLVFLGGAWYFQKYQTEKAASITPTAASKHLFDSFDPSKIVSVEIESNQDRSFLIAQDLTGQWVVDGFTATETITSTVNTLLTNIASLSILSELETGMDLSTVGLTEPAFILKVGLVDGQSRVASIGSTTPTNSGYYVQTEQGGTVVISKLMIDDLIDLLYNPPVATPVPAPTEPLAVETTPTPQP